MTPPGLDHQTPTEIEQGTIEPESRDRHSHRKRNNTQDDSVPGHNVLVDTSLLLRTGIVVLVMVGLATFLLRWQRVEIGLAPVVAIVRATIQLALLALILRGVAAAPVTVLLFIALILTTASFTASGRLAELPGGRRAAVIGVLTAGIGVPMLVLATGIVALQPNQIVAISGIVIGNSMSAATLAGRRFGISARSRTGEVEAWWALGASSPVAYDAIAREAVKESLLPSIDQTRTTGLVALPGAFVGALFGGASPWEAGRFQVIVLASLLLCMSITALVTTRLLSRSTTLLLTTSDTAA